MMDQRKTIGYVFVYGQWAAPGHWLQQKSREDLPLESLYGCLEGFKRNTAMAYVNNAVERDSSYYIDKENSYRAYVCIASMALDLSATGRTNGMAVPVSEFLLYAYCQHLRDDYEITGDVSADFSADLAGLPLWTFFPKAQRKETFATEIERNRVYIPDDYLSNVRAAFSAISTKALAEFEQLTELSCPVREMRLLNPVRVS